MTGGSSENDRLSPPPKGVVRSMSSLRKKKSLAGTRLGGFVLDKRIGMGGSSVVYRATRADGLGPSVAVKILQTAIDADVESIVLRFKREVRSHSAISSHEYVATLIDAGVTGDQQPYVVTEFVDGKPITAYCDLRRATVRERLKLFVEICTAVEYAHSNLIVHRDLKPANILVTAAGSPRLIDFGIAKCLNADLVPGMNLTADTRQHWFTFEYASPEQLRRDELTTGTDVFSLGVVLHELLTGHLPFGSKEISEQAILEFEPELPSRTAFSRRDTRRSSDDTEQEVTPQLVSDRRSCSPVILRRTLQGDLDGILLKAMAKSSIDRYQSVTELREDVQRHLSFETVHAHRPNSLDRLRKLYLRNKVASTLVLALSVLVLVAAIFSLIQNFRLDSSAQQLAKTNDEKSEAISNLRRRESELVSSQEKLEDARRTEQIEKTLATYNEYVALIKSAVQENGEALANHRIETLRQESIEPGWEWRYAKTLSRPTFDSVCILKDAIFLEQWSDEKNSLSWLVSSDGRIWNWTDRENPPVECSQLFDPDDGKLLVVLSTESQDCVISGILANSPVLTCDPPLQVGDVIVQVQTSELEWHDLSSENYARFLSGPSGEAVQLKVRRGDHGKLFRVSVVRRAAPVTFENDDRFVFDPKGSCLATIEHRTQEIRFWDVKTGELKHVVDWSQFKLPTGTVDLDFSPNGKLIALTDVNCSLHLIDAEHFEIQEPIKCLGVPFFVEFLSDTELITSGLRDELVIYDRRDGTHPRSIGIPFSDQVVDAKLLPGARDLLIRFQYNSEFACLDIASGRIRFVGQGHESPIEHIAVSSDGLFLASCCNDDLIIVWDVSRGREVLRRDCGRTSQKLVAIDPARNETTLFGADGSLAKSKLFDRNHIRTVQPSIEVATRRFLMLDDDRVWLAHEKLAETGYPDVSEWCLGQNDPDRLVLESDESRWSIVFSDSGRFLAIMRLNPLVTSKNVSIKIYDRAQAAVIYEGAMDSGNGVVSSFDAAEEFFFAIGRSFSSPSSMNLRSLAFYNQNWKRSFVQVALATGTEYRSYEIDAQELGGIAVHPADGSVLAQIGSSVLLVQPNASGFSKLDGIEGRVGAVRFSQDGSRLACVLNPYNQEFDELLIEGPCRVLVYDWNRREVTHVLDHFHSAIGGITFTDDQQGLIVAEVESRVTRTDFDNPMQPRWEFNASGLVRNMVHVPDLNSIAVATAWPSSLILVDEQDGSEICKLQDGLPPFLGIALDPFENQLVVHDQTTPKLQLNQWDIEFNSLVPFEVETNEQPTSDAFQISHMCRTRNSELKAITFDDGRVLQFSQSDRAFRDIFDREIEGQIIDEQATYMNDHSKLVIASVVWLAEKNMTVGTISEYSTLTGEGLRTTSLGVADPPQMLPMIGLRSKRTSLGFSNDRRWLASSGFGEHKNVIEFRDLTDEFTVKQTCEISREQRIVDISFSPNSQYLVVLASQIDEQNEQTVGTYFAYVHDLEHDRTYGSTPMAAYGVDEFGLSTAFVTVAVDDAMSIAVGDHEGRVRVFKFPSVHAIQEVGVDPAIVLNQVILRPMITLRSPNPGFPVQELQFSENGRDLIVHQVTKGIVVYRGTSYRR